MPLLKTVSVVLAMATLILITTSCTSTGSTAMRVVNTISNNQSIQLDAYVNGSLVNSSPLSFGQVYPGSATPVKYQGIPSGNDTIGIYDSPQTDPPTNPIYTTATPLSIGGGDQYTLILAGSINDLAAPPTTFLFRDAPPTATTGNVYFRVIDASVFLNQVYPGGLDVYIVPGAPGVGGSPQISALTYGTTGSGSSYLDIPFTSAQTEYTLYVTPHGNTTETLITQSYTVGNQQISTLIIYDTSTGNYFSEIPLFYTDLN